MPPQLTRVSTPAVIPPTPGGAGELPKKKLTLNDVINQQALIAQRHLAIGFVDGGGLNLDVSWDFGWFGHQSLGWQVGS